MIKLREKKIFFAFNSGKPVQDLWQYFHFIDELKKYQIEFELFNSFDFNNDFEEMMIRKIRSMKDHISMFFTGFADFQISENCINEIKKIGIPTVLICYDNLSVPYNHYKVSRCFDLVWLTSLETQYLFKKWGAKTIFLPYAANPNKFYPDFSGEIPLIGFIGSLYGSRSYKIRTISGNGIPVKVFSNEAVSSNIFTHKNFGPVGLSHKLKDTFKHIYMLSKFEEGRRLLKGEFIKALKKRVEKNVVFNEHVQFAGSIPFTQMNKLYSDFALSLGIIELWNTYLLKHPVFKIHLRTFEIPMCGGLQITNRCNEIENYFVDGKEIVLYGSNEEMINKMRFYLKDENESLRKKMKQAARLRAEKDHSWYNRFSKIHEKLF